MLSYEISFFNKQKANSTSNRGYGGRATVETTGLNPAGDLISGEHLGNKVCEENKC